MRRIKTLSTLALLVAVTVASSCASDVVPTAGVWNYNPGEVLENTCDEDPYNDPYGMFEILEPTAEGFRVNTYDDADPFDCTLAAGEFSCPSRLEVSQPIDPFDATLKVNVSVSGSFSSEREGAGEQQVDVTCDGGDCAGLAAIAGVMVPCSYRVAFEIDAL